MLGKYSDQGANWCPQARFPSSETKVHCPDFIHVIGTSKGLDHDPNNDAWVSGCLQSFNIE